MRLLDTIDLTINEFSGPTLPYAILSHRWEDEEVTLQDMRDGKGPNMKGWAKLVGCCKQAYEDGLRYVWIDTCCIDKTSSAELSEAINSMFLWYHMATVCYAYLSDVPGLGDGNSSILRNVDFRSSKWFTRGWTLQELLAPKTLVFFDNEWGEIGTKRSLGDLVAQASGIHPTHLFNVRKASIAQKMSWASKRETTRLEDKAYSLMGIFGVNMPLLYGEGSKAFFRLQLEIMRMSNDESLFAWTAERSTYMGLLAPSPTAFQFSGDVEVANFQDSSRSPYSMTNKGLEIELSFVPVVVNGLETYILAPLNCRRGRHGRRLAVYLTSPLDDDQFYRTSCHTLYDIGWEEGKVTGSGTYNVDKRVVYIKQDDLPTGKPATLFLIRTSTLRRRGFSILERYISDPAQSRWEEDSVDGHRLMVFADTGYAILTMKLHRDQFGLVIYYNDQQEYPLVGFITADGDQSIHEVALSYLLNLGARPEFKARLGQISQDGYLPSGKRVKAMVEPMMFSRIGLNFHAINVTLGEKSIVGLLGSYFHKVLDSGAQKWSKMFRMRDGVSSVSTSTSTTSISSGAFSTIS